MVSKDFKIGMHLDVYIPTWFKLGMRIDATRFYVLILVYMTLTMIQGHRFLQSSQSI